MKKFATCLVVTSSVALTALPVFAENEMGLSGSVGVGFMVIDSADNLNPEGSSKRIDSLDASPGKQTTVLPAVLPNVTWNVGNTGGVRLYFKADPPIDEVGSYALNIGASYTIDGLGTFDSGFFVTPFAKAWKDPFLVGEARDETDLSVYGLQFGLDKILGSGLFIQLVYMNTEVDDDLIGERIPELSRDGAIYSLKVGYAYNINPRTEIRPMVSVRAGDYDGDANTYTKYKFEFRSRHQFGRLFLIPSIYYDYKKYDERNPIFGKTREDNSYGTSLVATYLTPFDMQDWSLTGLVSFSRGDSNIDFFETEATTAGVMVSYNF